MSYALAEGSGTPQSVHRLFFGYVVPFIYGLYVILLDGAHDGNIHEFVGMRLFVGLAFMAYVAFKVREVELA